MKLLAFKLNLMVEENLPIKATFFHKAQFRFKTDLAKSQRFGQGAIIKHLLVTRAIKLNK